MLALISRSLSFAVRALAFRIWSSVDHMRSVFQWSLGVRTLELGKRTLVMGIVSATPDSFSDGGLYFDADNAITRGLGLIEEGADIVDIGGESRRPGGKGAAGGGAGICAGRAQGWGERKE